MHTRRCTYSVSTDLELATCQLFSSSTWQTSGQDECYALDMLSLRWPKTCCLSTSLSRLNSALANAAMLSTITNWTLWSIMVASSACTAIFWYNDTLFTDTNCEQLLLGIFFLYLECNDSPEHDVRHFLGNSCSWYISRKHCITQYKVKQNAFALVPQDAQKVMHVSCEAHLKIEEGA